MKQPEQPSDFEPFEGEGFVVHVHRATLAESEVPGLVRFNFGSFGWCDLHVSPSGEP